MADSTKTKTGESSGMTIQMRISEMISDRITDRKLDGIITCSEMVIEIYVAGREKTNHLLVDSPILVTDACTLNDNILLHQIMTMMKLNIQDLYFIV